MKKALLVFIVILTIWAFYDGQNVVTLGPGVKASEEPTQATLTSAEQHTIGDYTVSELARFDIKAKVLAKSYYRLDRGSDLSPIDLALGWGRMSDETILNQIKISQSGRFYFWRVQSFPIPRREIETQSANMHLIPYNDAIRQAINDIKVGEVVSITGSLVEVKSNTDSWRWKSSLTRGDTGAGACELILVKNVTPIAQQ